MKYWSVLLALFALLLFDLVSAENADLNVTLQLVTTVNTQPNIDSTIVEMAHAGDDRLFIVEQGGRISIYDDGELLAEPFLDLSAEVETNCWECGLLGLTFHPNFAVNGQFFVNYSEQSSNDTIIERFQVCLLYTSPSPRDLSTSRMPSSA